MQVTREALITHLNKISCGGKLPETVFTGAFETAALTEDQLLIVVAPPLPKVEPLSEEVGISDLPLLVKSLGVLSGQGNDKTKVTVRIDKKRLLIDEEHRGLISFMTAGSGTIATRIKPPTLKKLLGQKPKGEGAPITKSLIDGIQSTFSLLKAQEVELHLHPDGGKVVVGNEHSHLAEFPHPELADGDQEYTLLFGDHLVEVLKVVSDFSEARMHFTGPNSLLFIDDGTYSYILSPRQKGADE